jgi:hypothetical protein
MNWYWLVTGRSQIWSSEALNYIPYNNAAYIAWTNRGNHPTKITAEDLVQVMQSQVRPMVMKTGMTVKSPKKLIGIYALDDASHARITTLANSLAAGRPLPGGGSTFNFADNTGKQHPFTAAEFLAFAHACDNFIYNWDQALRSIIMGDGGSFPGPASLT